MVRASGAGGWVALTIVLACLSGCAADGPRPGSGDGEVVAIGTGAVQGGAPGQPRPAWAARPAGTARGERSADGDRFSLGFDDKPAPEVFQAELTARRDRPKGTQGLWITVAGLRRAETAEVVNLSTGATTRVALFNGAVARGEARVSNAAAELLGIGAAPVRIRITALRREPVLLAP